LEKTVKEIDAVKIPTPAIKDDRTVRMGYMTPAFPPICAASPKAADNGRVRMGYMSPAFPPAARTR
jgi:hypothetical protein